MDEEELSIYTSVKNTEQLPIGDKNMDKVNYSFLYFFECQSITSLYCLFEDFHQRGSVDSLFVSNLFYQVYFLGGWISILSVIISH